jgi:hypothetical protein
VTRKGIPRIRGTERLSVITARSSLEWKSCVSDVGLISA